MTFALSGTWLKVIITCYGAICSLEVLLWAVHPHSWPSKGRLWSPCSCRPCIFHLELISAPLSDKLYSNSLSAPRLPAQNSSRGLYCPQMTGRLESKNSTGSEIQRLAYRLLGLETSLFINTPQIHLMSANVSSSSPPTHLAKGCGHSMSSYFQLLKALGIVDHHTSPAEMLGSPSFHAHPCCEALLSLPLLSLLCWHSFKWCSPLGLCPQIPLFSLSKLFLADSNNHMVSDIMQMLIIFKVLYPWMNLFPEFPTSILSQYVYLAVRWRFQSYDSQKGNISVPGYSSVSHLTFPTSINRTFMLPIGQSKVPEFTSFPLATHSAQEVLWLCLQNQYWMWLLLFPLS